MKREYLDALNFRHACKVFDETKSISKEDFDFILECGRLSPSSFGMEQWRFSIIRDKDLREKLKPLCWDQKQITTCSELVLIKAQIDVVDGKTPYVETMFSKRGLPADATAAYIEKYAAYIENRKKQESVASWAGRQCYIAAGNMMSGAAFIGIDSCPIEGFEKENVEKLLNIDTTKEEAALIVAFGYRINEQPKKHRLPIENLVEYI